MSNSNFKTSLDESLLERLALMYLDRHLDSSTNDSLATMVKKSVKEAVQTVLGPHLETQSTIVSDFIPKNSSKSQDYRIKGNQTYQKRNFVKSIEYFNYAILYAENNSQSLALAYGNRSAIFFELKKFPQCIVDIDLALQNGFGKFCSIEKLLSRKLECLLAMGHIDEETKAKLSDQKESLLNDIEELRKKLKISAKELENEKSNMKIYEKYLNDLEFGLYSSKIQICKSKEKGRFLIAKQDFQPGEIILIENPYVKFLKNEFEMKYCHNCCKKLQPLLQNIVPCKQCCNVLFCSMDCFNESWNSYHQYECLILSNLKKIPAGHLAARILLITSVEKLEETFQKIDIDDNHNIEVFKKVQNPKLFKLDYEAVYSLVDHFDKLTEKQIDELIHVAACFFKLLKKIKWFDSPQKDLLNICLKHVGQIRVNTHCIENDCTKNNNFQMDYDTPGMGIYPAISLFNHSCDPNAIRTFKQGSTIFVRARRLIRAGEEITITYLQPFYKLDYKHRQERLMKEYFFHCKCQICQDENPQSKPNYEIEKKLEKLKTISVDQLLLKQEKFLREFSKPKRNLYAMKVTIDELILSNYNKSNFNVARKYCQVNVNCVKKLCGDFDRNGVQEMLKLTRLTILYAESSPSSTTIAETIETIKKTIEEIDKYAHIYDDVQDDFVFLKEQSKKLHEILEDFNKKALNYNKDSK